MLIPMTTTLTTTQIEDIQSLVSNLDNAEVRSYSGRNMYGRSCLGIDMESMTDAFCFALSVQDEDLALLLDSPAFDNMGRGIIVYFPDVEVPEGFDEDEDEDDDED
jgi:hypothetical protein